MEFLEGSRGIYRPIRVLFDTPIYERALQICWHVKSYKCQIALMMELLKLQQKNLIPSQVTAEDMINLILEESKSTVREHLWEFELEDFDEEDAKPLLMLVWAVNVSNKMRDVEFEARMLLNSPQAVPPNFQHPKVLSIAQEYAEILREKQQNTPRTKLLCPREVALEVVPRVLQGFWVLPPRPLLNMPSLKLSKLSVGVTKAVLDKVSNALPSGEHQATFSSSIRDHMVLSVLTEIRQTYPLDILLNMIKSFAPVLLSKIVDVAVGQIHGMFQPESPKVSAHLRPAVATAVQDDLSLSPSPHPDVEPAACQTTPPFIATVQAREDEMKKPSLEMNTDPSTEPDTAFGPASLTSPAEPCFSTDGQAREDEIKMPSLEMNTDPSTEPDTAFGPTPLTSPAVSTRLCNGSSFSCPS